MSTARGPPRGRSAKSKTEAGELPADVAPCAGSLGYQPDGFYMLPGVVRGRCRCGLARIRVATTRGLQWRVDGALAGGRGESRKHVESRVICGGDGLRHLRGMVGTIFIKLAIGQDDHGHPG